VGIPFGWKLAPWVFTKFTRPIGAALRFPVRAQELGFPGLLGQQDWSSKDVFSQIYLDDILVLSPSPERQKAAMDVLLDLLTRLGVMFHPHKCVLEPTRQVEYLGMLLDIPKQQFRLTDKQLTRLRTRTTDILIEA
jgi:hypothetical protein